MSKAGDGRRVQMVEKQVLQSVAGFIARYLSREYEALVTATRVKMPADLKAARVYISILGLNGERMNEEFNDLVIKDISERASDIQKHVDAELKLRFCPRLHFEIDDSSDKILHVENILHQLGQKKTHE